MWREPACVLRSGVRDYALDWKGRPFPIDYPAGSTGMPAILGVGAGVPLRGGVLDVLNPWPGEDVSSALELLAPLLREPFAAPVAGTDVTDYYTAWGLARFMPGMAGGLSPFLEKVGRFRKHLDLPTFHACRVAEIATARHAVRDGLVDMVGMTRAHMADPHIVRKIEAGEEDRIRPCVGSTYCATNRGCIHNPATGRVW